MSPPLLTKEILDQISKVKIDHLKPLLISDADEVIVNMISCFEKFISKKDLYYDLSSYALFGNIKKNSDQSPVDNKKVIELLDEFYDNHTMDITFVNDALIYLKKIESELNIQIIILSNLPLKNRMDREKSFNNNGLYYPVIANSGPKGPAIKEITKQFIKETFFIDDISINLLSARESVNNIKTIHYISDDRISKLAQTPKGVNLRANNWSDIYKYIKNEINR